MSVLRQSDLETAERIAENYRTRKPNTVPSAVRSAAFNVIRTVNSWPVWEVKIAAVEFLVRLSAEGPCVKTMPDNAWRAYLITLEMARDGGGPHPYQDGTGFLRLALDRTFVDGQRLVCRDGKRFTDNTDGRWNLNGPLYRQAESRRHKEPIKKVQGSRTNSFHP